MERYLSYYNFDPIQLIRCQRDEQHYFRLIANDGHNPGYSQLPKNALSEELLTDLAALLEPTPVPRLLKLTTGYGPFHLDFQHYDPVAQRYHGEWTSHFLFGVGIAYSSFSVSRDSLARFCRDVQQHLTDLAQTIASRT